MGDFPITITAQMRHGILWEARQKLGSTKALAAYLGFSQQHLGHLVNFKWSPGGRWIEIHGERVENKLTLLLGRSIAIADVFPAELMSEAFQKRQKQIEYTFFADPAKLVEAGAMPALPPMPDEMVLGRELDAKIGDVLATLSPREEKVIKMRYGLGESGKEHTYEEVAERFFVTRERIRQIEAKALKKLRCPERSRKLKPFIEPNFPDQPKKNKGIRRVVEKGFEIVSQPRRQWAATLSSAECSSDLIARATEAFYRHDSRVFSLR